MLEAMLQESVTTPLETDAVKAGVPIVPACMALASDPATMAEVTPVPAASTSATSTRHTQLCLLTEEPSIPPM